MGAMTYIGNGPNFMVRSIAESSGVKMPSFFGYMVYSFLILLPILALVDWLISSSRVHSANAVVGARLHRKLLSAWTLLLLGVGRQKLSEQPTTQWIDMLLG